MSHFELQQDPTQDKFLDFLQTYFEFEDAFAPNFSKNGGAGPVGPAKAQRVCPPPFIENKGSAGFAYSPSIIRLASQK